MYKMMNVFMFLMIVAVAYAATASEKLPEKPQELAHKEGCYIKHYNDVVPFGTILTPIGRCVRITCGNNAIRYATCGIVDTSDPKCYITKEDLTKSYPDCCPGIKCESSNNV